MLPTLQLLERQRTILDKQPVHWFDAPAENPLGKQGDQYFSLLWHPANNSQTDQQNWPTAKYNVLFYPKAKERLHWWLEQLSNSLTAGQQLWVVGHNDGGIKSLAKRVKNQFKCQKIDSARHCVAYELLPEIDLPTTQWWQTFNYQETKISALPGVFAAGKLDKGTEILLNVLPTLHGNVFEFGAGCGILTTQLARQHKVSRVTAVEIDLLAVRSAQRTIDDNNYSNKVAIHWSAGTSNLPNAKFDAIVTNPPFHQGIRTAYAPTEDFFRSAKDWLTKNGQLIWVANDFLDYQSLLKPDFSNIETLTHERGFKVFRAIKNHTS